MTPNQFYVKLQSLQLQQIATESLSKHTDAIADLTREQLMDGLDSNGNPLKMYKSDWYARMKQAMNARAGFGTPDLKLTGSFHESINVQIEGGNIITTANDPNDLENRYSEAGGNPLIMNSATRAQLIEQHLYKTFIDAIQAKIFS